MFRRFRNNSLLNNVYTASKKVGNAMKRPQAKRRLRKAVQFLPVNKGEWRKVLPPSALSEPYVSLSTHTAPIIQSCPFQ